MDMKKKIRDIIGCRGIDRYSNEENGFLTQTSNCSDELKVNMGSFKIEI